MIATTSAAVVAIAAANSATHGSHVQRNCIVVDSKTYCEETTTTPKDLGAGILFFVIAICYIIWVTNESLDRDNGWIAIGGLLGPPALIGLLMVVVFG